MVSGCSAGGVGSFNNYPFIRNGMVGAEASYLIADSGPVMPSMLLSGEPSHASRLYETISGTWNVAEMIESLGSDGERILADFGEVNAVVSETFPEDRLAISIFERDYNFTVANYESFFPIFAEEESSVSTGPGRTEIYRLASEDLEALRAQLDEFPNLVYFIPYYRNTNTSHCLTVTGLEDVGTSELDFINAFQDDASEATWTGTEIEGVTFKDFIEQVLDDSVPLESYYEGTCEGRFQVCAQDCEAFDVDLCAAEVE